MSHRIAKQLRQLERRVSNLAQWAATPTAVIKSESKPTWKAADAEQMSAKPEWGILQWIADFFCRRGNRHTQ